MMYAGVCRELRDQLIAARNCKPPWSTKAFIRTVCEFEQHDVITSGISTDGFRDKGPLEWTKQAVTTLEEATESYMVEVIAEASF
jgi:hypothetical protein